MRRAVIKIDKKGKVTLPEWAWKGLLKQSGSKATSESGMRKAIKKQFIKALRKLEEEG